MKDVHERIKRTIEKKVKNIFLNIFQERGREMKQIDEMTHEEVKRFAEMVISSALMTSNSGEPGIRTPTGEMRSAGWTKRKEALLDLFWQLEEKKEKASTKRVTDEEIEEFRRRITVPAIILCSVNLQDVTSKPQDLAEKSSCRHVVPEMHKMQTTDYFGISCEYECPKCGRFFALHQEDFPNSEGIICPFNCLVEEK